MTHMRVQSSNIAHDLRTPLARLRAKLETLLHQRVEHNHSVSAEDLSAALEQIDHITGTFNALLRLTQIESGVQRASFTSIKLSEIGKKIEETFGPVVEDGGQTLVLDVTGDGYVIGDADLLIQLIANLIKNALRYGPVGQTIFLTINSHSLVLTDQGSGIPLAERESVLEPLYQGEGARQGQGVGLGLSIVRAICELHNARLSLNHGHEGVGLMVSVTFSCMM